MVLINYAMRAQCSVLYNYNIYQLFMVRVKLLVLKTDIYFQLQT